MDDHFDNQGYLQFLLKYCDVVKDEAFERVPGAKQVAAHLSVLSLSPDMRVLEIGCGTGRVLEILHREFGVIAEGCDVSSYALDHLKENRPLFADKVTLLDGHGLEVYADSKYDAAVYWGVFELTPQRAHLGELSRLLKLGGRVFISSIKHPRPFSDDEDAQAALSAYETKKIPLYLTDPEPFEAAAQAFGFEVEQRIVFERKADVVANVFDIDKGGARTFSEAFYVLKKTANAPAAAAFNTTFARGTP